MLIRTLPFIAAIAVAIAATTVAPSQASHPCSGPPFIFGDATDDDLVDLADVDINLRTLVDPEPPFTHSACGAFDVDCDGEITAIDALRLLKYSAHVEYEPVAECPEIGSDTGG